MRSAGLHRLHFSRGHTNPHRHTVTRPAAHRQRWGAVLAGQVLANRWTRAALTLLAFFWLGTICFMAEWFFGRVLALPASCLDKHGDAFPILTLWFLLVGRFIYRFWFFLAVPLGFLAVVPRHRFFRLLPLVLLLIVAAFQTLAAWAVADAARASVDCFDLLLTEIRENR